MRKFILSPHTLNLFIECPRCFWFHMVRGGYYKRPQQPASTLPSGMDGLIKKYFDVYRQKQLMPPEIKDIKGRLIEKSHISKWRNWKTGLKFTDNDGCMLIGALDECLIENNMYIPMDYKTRGFPLKYDSTSYYTLQMSCYNFLLHKNNYSVSNYAYLVFYIPSDYPSEGIIKFGVEPIRIETYHLDKVYSIFRSALSTIFKSEPPPMAQDCPFCGWSRNVSEKRTSQTRLF